MRLINNPWVDNPQYNCYGCCPSNPIGTKMRFHQDGDQIVCFWRPTQNHQSWVDTLHGGVQAVLLDEVCGWVVFHILQTAGVTAKMETRYRKPVSTRHEYLECRAWLEEMRRNIALVHGEIRSPEGEVLVECTCTYFTFSQEKAQTEMGYLPSTLGEEELTKETILSL